MKVLKLIHIENDNEEDDVGSWCIYDAQNCPALFEEISTMQYCEVGETWKIIVEEMSKEDFENLPEFIGW